MRDCISGTGTAVTKVSPLDALMLYHVPGLGFQLADGTWFENEEIEPDVLMRNGLL
ncbi:hypothetical protein [Qingshengfaniella alkalisoli]|uniref:hypothetical protein n=1 Tax=Qingshengfaniella alkalisoli TaxID=2599296 RepID=UPI00143D9EF7|nr:hypothetical protein [Qingshengfaniella alkalisoli]